MDLTDDRENGKLEVSCLYRYVPERVGYESVSRMSLLYEPVDQAED